MAKKKTQLDRAIEGLRGEVADKQREIVVLQHAIAKLEATQTRDSTRAAVRKGRALTAQAEARRAS